MENKEVTLTLNVQEINVLLSGLGKLPLETSINVFAKIKQIAEAEFNKKPKSETGDA